MNENDLDTQGRMAAFEQGRRLNAVHDHLRGKALHPGFLFEGECIPLVNLQRGIFKPRQMRLLLSLTTVFPRPGSKIWYDDQREVHRQIFAGDETVDYAFMGQDPEAADNRWLHEAYKHRIPVIYFLGIAPGCVAPLETPEECPGDKHTMRCRSSSSSTSSSPSVRWRTARYTRARPTATRVSTGARTAFRAGRIRSERGVLDESQKGRGWGRASDALPARASSAACGSTRLSTHQPSLVRVLQ